jgi:hypothetical protein
MFSNLLLSKLKSTNDIAWITNYNTLKSYFDCRGHIKVTKVKLLLLSLLYSMLYDCTIN